MQPLSVALPQASTGPRNNGPSVGTTLGALMHSTDKSVIELLESPDGLDVEIRSIALVESSDIDGTDSRGAISDIYLPVGVPESTLTQWLRKFEGRPARRRPKLLLVKNAREATTVLTAARNIGIAVAAVHPQASSGHVYSLVLRLLTQSMYRSRTVAGAVAGGDSDLFALSETIAELTGGLVTIDDTALHVIAYSSAHEGEDELRQLSILGREWPIEYTEWIESRGVFEHLRRSDEVISLPSEPSIGAAQRLAVSITRPDLSAPTGSVAHQHNLGSIWVQRASEPLSHDAQAVLRGAAAVAARILMRTLDASSRENAQVQRLFGVRSGGVDMHSLAGSFGINTDGPSAVIGFATSLSPGSNLDRITNALRLRASAFRSDAVTTIIDNRIYVLFPQADHEVAVSDWAYYTVRVVEDRAGISVRAAVAVPIARLHGVPEARREVDRVLDTTDDHETSKVTTLAASRTAVLLGEILDLVADHERLRDPRIDRLVSYDDKNTSDMQFTLTAYLTAFGDVKKAASSLKVHPNTLRYRIRRAEQIMGISLDEPDTRLLTELQLAILGRTQDESEKYETSDQ